MLAAFLEKSKINRILANFGTSFFKAIVTSLLGLIVTPFIVGYVGDESYGIFKLIFDWVSNVWLFDLGVSGAFFALGAVQLKSKNKDDFLREGLIRHFKVLPFIALGSVIFYFTLLSIINFDTVSISTFTVGYTLVSLTFLFFPLNVCRQYFEIFEKISLINLISSFQLFFTNIVTLIFAYLGFGLIGLCLSYLIGVIINYVCILRIFFQAEGVSIFKRKAYKKSDYSSISRNSFKISLSQKISFLADNSIIAYFHSPALVTSFFISQRLPALFQNQLQGVTFSIWASLVDFWNKGDREGFKIRFYEVLKVNLILSQLFLVIVLVMNESFISVWIGDKYYLGNNFNIITSFLMIINVYNFFYGHLLSGTGFLKKQSNMYLGLGILNLGVSILLTYKISYIGPVVGSIITMSLLMFYKVFLMIKLYELSKSKVIFYLIRSLVFSILFYFCAIKFKTYIGDIGWVKLFVFSGALSCGYLLLSIFVLLSSEDRNKWKRRIQSLVNKKS